MLGNSLLASLLYAHMSECFDVTDQMCNFFLCYNYCVDLMKLLY